MGRARKTIIGCVGVCGGGVIRIWDVLVVGAGGAKRVWDAVGEGEGA